MHLPPCKLLASALGPPDLLRNNDAQVTIPVALLRLMLEAILETQDVDEAAYRRTNPDVGAAISAGRIRSAYEHYRSSGYFEGRRGAEAAFNEVWYLQRYADVRSAVASGKYRTGWDHYQAEGMHEWRSPNATAEVDLHRWRQALARQAPPATVKQPEAERSEAVSPKPSGPAPLPGHTASPRAAKAGPVR
jgi:hypothetical protein